MSLSKTPNRNPHPVHKSPGRWALLSIIGVVSLPATLASCGQKKPPPRPSNAHVPVHVDAVAESIRAQHIKASGVTVPRRDAVLASQVRGVVTQLKVKLGQRVKKGAVLARVSTVGLFGQFQGAKATIAQVKTDIALTRRDVRTNKRLMEQGAGTRRAFEDAEFKLRRLTSQLAGARATLAQIGDNYRGGTVRAPFSGVISSKNVEVGDYVNPGQIVGRLVGLDELLITASVAEQDVMRIRKDTRVRLTFPAAGNHTAPGRVHAVAPTAEPSTGAYTIEVIVDNRQGHLKGGMSAQVVFEQAGEAGLFLPNTAVRSRDGRRVVYVLRADRQHVDQRSVTLGAARDGTVRVRSGIRPGDHVVVSGATRLEHGTRVRVITGLGLAASKPRSSASRPAPAPTLGALVQ